LAQLARLKPRARETLDIYTFKTSNFGPHGNFGTFFSEGLAIIKTRPTEK
jgi:hypothetical protein